MQIEYKGISNLLNKIMTEKNPNSRKKYKTKDTRLSELK